MPFGFSPISQLPFSTLPTQGAPGDDSVVFPFAASRGEPSEDAPPLARLLVIDEIVTPIIVEEIAPLNRLADAPDTIAFLPFNEAVAAVVAEYGAPASLWPFWDQPQLGVFAVFDEAVASVAVEEAVPLWPLRDPVALFVPPFVSPVEAAGAVVVEEQGPLAAHPPEPPFVIVLPADAVAPFKPTPPPFNPLLSPLAQGGQDEEHWQRRSVQDGYDEKLGYWTRPYGFNDDVAWELSDDPFQPGRPVTMAAFTGRILGGAREEERRATFSAVVKEIARQDREEMRQRQKIVKVTITVAGVTYIAWRLLPLL